MTEITMQQNLNMLQNKPPIMQKWWVVLSFSPCEFQPWPVPEWWCSWIRGSEPRSRSPARDGEESKRCMERETGGPAAHMQTHENKSKYEIKFPLCENRVCFFKCAFIPGSGCCGGSPGGGRRGGWTWGEQRFAEEGCRVFWAEQAKPAPHGSAWRWSCDWVQMGSWLLHCQSSAGVQSQISKQLW